MIRTPLTDLLGIRLPIIQGGMQWLATGELAAAVSNAGGLGTICALSFPSADEFRDELKKAKGLTDKPICVNISMLPVVTSNDIYDIYFDILLEEGVRVVETSGRSPEGFVPRLKQAGVKIIHKVPAVRFARKAESLGVDAVTVVGYECGGHPGLDDVTSLILIQKAARTIKIPIVAAGGYCDGRGLLAALALGASGILMGTRFMATKECIAHPNFKSWMMKAQETDTMIVERSIRNPARVRRNKAAEEVLELEKQGATLADLLPHISGKMGLEAYRSGDLDMGVIACGQIVGALDDVPSVRELMDRIASEADETLGRLTGICAGRNGHRA
ncbi:MAG: nitronate monooxygenase [Nitrospirae bacterium]|nr:nitronate monooxygenase [Nitrospirota bacterium]